MAETAPTVCTGSATTAIPMTVAIATISVPITTPRSVRVASTMKEDNQFLYICFTKKQKDACCRLVWSAARIFLCSCIRK